MERLSESPQRLRRSCTVWGSKDRKTAKHRRDRFRQEEPDTFFAIFLQFPMESGLNRERIVPGSKEATHHHAGNVTPGRPPRGQLCIFCDRCSCCSGLKKSDLPGKRVFPGSQNRCTEQHILFCFLREIPCTGSCSVHKNALWPVSCSPHGMLWKKAPLPFKHICQNTACRADEPGGVPGSAGRIRQEAGQESPGNNSRNFSSRNCRLQLAHNCIRHTGFPNSPYFPQNSAMCVGKACPSCLEFDARERISATSQLFLMEILCCFWMNCA